MRPVVFIFSAWILLSQLPVTFATEETAQRPTRTPSYTREGSKTCLHCHSGEKMRAVLASPHFNPDIEGTPATMYECESCHGKGSIHSSRAHGGKGFPSLTEFGQGSRGSPRDQKLHACLSCHADESMGKMQTIFTDSIHDRPTINCSNCHVAHAVSDPMRDIAAQKRSCNRCHRGDISKHAPVDGESVDFDTQSCSECHDVHAPVDNTGAPEA